MGASDNSDEIVESSKPSCVFQMPIRKSYLQGSPFCKVSLFLLVLTDIICKQVWN
jgi:hypothetical protein